MKGNVEAFLYILGALVFFALAFILFITVSQNINISSKTKEGKQRLDITESTIYSLKPVLYSLLINLENEIGDKPSYTEDNPYLYSFTVSANQVLNKGNIIKYLEDFGFVVRYSYSENLNAIKECIPNTDEENKDPKTQTDICVIETKDDECVTEIEEGKIYLVKIWEDLGNKYLYLCMKEVGQVE